MNYIKGNYKSTIFESPSGYKIGLFRIKETNDDELEDYLNKTITFTGYFTDLNTEDKYIFYGELVNHERYGFQYLVKSYEKVEPVGENAVIEFLSSSLIKGCGEKTATAIVSVLGEDAINKIKANKNNLLLIPNMSERKATNIFNSLTKYFENDDLIIKLKEYGFSIKEISTIINKYGDNIFNILKENVYQLKDIVSFKKLDDIFLKYNDYDSITRIKACIIECMLNLVQNSGDTYHFKEEIFLQLKKQYQIVIEEEIFNNALKYLFEENKIIIDGDKIYLIEYYEMEIYIANALNIINNQKITEYKNIKKSINNIEKLIDLKLSINQKEAVENAISNNVCIITGGPGTGKTTVVNAIVKLFIDLNNYNNFDILKNIVLLAPTGRASKRLSEITHLPAKTIHRFLKWNKEKNEFQINENNKSEEKLIIVDEVSMVDTLLIGALLHGVKRDIKIILIGDENQLPSVGGGLVLNDIIDSEKFVHINLTEIFRQSSESFIPYLARDIKNHYINDEFFSKKNDYNFIETSSENIKKNIFNICEIGLKHQIDERKTIVLAPIYKGENGIDNLNILLQNIYNPKSEDKKEFKYADIIYRENDKVIELVNDIENNVFNGDIGYIEKINPYSKEIMIVDFDGIKVIFKKDDLIKIKHAYAISIHKSQGSEFNHVIIPISSAYNRMLYNKILYTAVSRAKDSLIIIGNSYTLKQAIMNDYSLNRKTTLKERIMNMK